MAERPLKIALVHAADRGGGAQECVWSLHQGLLELGHDSRLYVGYKYSDDPTVQEIERVRTIPGLLRLALWLEKTLGWQHLYAPGFRRLLDVIPPDTDILHLHSLWGSGGYADIGGVPRLTRRFPTLLTLHESWLLTGHCACYFDCRRWTNGCGDCPDLERTMPISRDGTRFNWLRKRLALRRSRLVITTVSDWLRQEAEKSPLLSGKRITVVHNGVDTSLFAPGVRAEARKVLGIPADKVVVLLAGQTIEGINEGIAQQAVAALNRCRDVGILPLLIGKSASRVAESLTIPCMILPFQDTPEAMATCYRAADVTMVTSEFETFGRIAAESQACGIPVIAFATGGLPEVVKDGVGGLVVPTGDVNALEEALRRLLDAQAERERLGRDGIRWVRERFDNRMITQEYLDLYRRLITDPKFCMEARGS